MLVIALGGVSRRLVPGQSDGRHSCVEAWAQNARGTASLRLGRGGRRSRRIGGRRIWSGRRTAHAAHRARGAGWTGGPEFTDRELSRVSDRLERGGFGAASGGPGPAVWSGDPGPTGSGGGENRRAVQRSAIGR